jgi:hypothetical protein
LIKEAWCGAKEAKCTAQQHAKFDNWNERNRRRHGDETRNRPRKSASWHAGLCWRCETLETALAGSPAFRWQRHQR